MIWVVCDDQATCTTLAGLIKTKGYEVHGIVCGDDFRKHIRFQTPELVIIDCGIADAFEMIRDVRGQRRAQPTAVIVFSRDELNLREKALAHGADAYVPKGSLDWAELLDEIQKFARPPGAETGPFTAGGGS